MKGPLSAVIVSIGLTAIVLAQGPGPSAGLGAGGAPFRIETLDAALSSIVDANAELETLGDRFALTEGPVWMPDASGGVCATNVAFGDADFRTLYITACTHVFSIRLKVAGSRRPAI